MPILEKLRIQTQVILVMMLLYFITISIIIGILLLNIHLIQEFMSSSSINVLNKQVESQIEFVSTFTIYNIKLKSLRNKGKLLMVNQLKQFLLVDDIKLFPPEECIDQYISLYSGKTSFCYGIYGDINHQNIKGFQDFSNLTGLLSYSQLMMDNYFDLLYASISEEEFFTIWPGEIFNSDYKPHLRPWYISHIQQIQENQYSYQTYFSTPYKHKVYNSTTTSRTISVYNNYYEILGIASIQLNFTLTFPTLLLNTLNLQAFIVDSDNNLLFGAEQYDVVKKLFDVNVTGFNITDVQIILNTNESKDIYFQCKSLQTHLPCLKNKIRQKDVIVKRAYLIEEGEILILTIDPATDISVIEDHKQDIESQLQLFSLQIMENSLIVFVSCLIIALILLYQLTRPLSNLVQQIIKTIYSESSSQQRKLKVTKFSLKTYQCFSTIFNLLSAFYHLSSGLAQSSSKHIQCRFIESIQQYHIQSPDVSTIFIKQVTKLLTNNVNNISNISLHELINLEQQVKLNKILSKRKYRILLQ